MARAATKPPPTNVSMATTVAPIVTAAGTGLRASHTKITAAAQPISSASGTCVGSEVPAVPFTETERIGVGDRTPGEQRVEVDERHLARI